MSHLAAGDAVDELICDGIVAVGGAGAEPAHRGFDGCRQARCEDVCAEVCVLRKELRRAACAQHDDFLHWVCLLCLCASIHAPVFDCTGMRSLDPG